MVTSAWNTKYYLGTCVSYTHYHSKYINTTYVLFIGCKYLLQHTALIRYLQREVSKFIAEIHKINVCKMCARRHLLKYTALQRYYCVPKLQHMHRSMFLYKITSSFYKLCFLWLMPTQRGLFIFVVIAQIMYTIIYNLIIWKHANKAPHIHLMYEFHVVCCLQNILVMFNKI